MNLAQSLREEILTILAQCRQSTLNVLARIDLVQFYQQAHPDFSPVGWHLGHIAFTEAYWILEYLAGLPPIFPEYKSLFAADGLPKSQRQYLPAPEIIQNYLNIVRSKVIAYLEIAPLESQERLWRWLIQHESQHGETIALILHLWGDRSTTSTTEFNPVTPAMVTIPAGEIYLGSNRIEAQDNERPVTLVHLDSYLLDQYPVTCKEYKIFIEAGGYQNPQWWSQGGWDWLQANSITQPLYWDHLPSDYPVYGVSWYEAQAYAQFAGKRLPTEAEWEKAASWDLVKNKKYDYPWGDIPPTCENCNYNLNLGGISPVNAYPLGRSPVGCYDMLGNVWEWTASSFSGYPGFESYPYRGYSQAYFDGKHRVLKGGSWATRSWALRTSFRNWYYPEVRQILAGFRCAQ
ncbi:SUMF1/EgtB/PvdO family nonheme iron enzyme [Gloeocapsa sp. PCC 73106]|uniref:SUMF1/EgtB/PvdO family nonheme iron enzyme n=1 Tax=Gloeocapsa sp. PCC 73106 TaxID=102232 RepID=UPI001EE68A25|nr:SUMF1/EgtB/PvdO family nonheme iron enzyme [Gloeocapsa sp. PCC 73106]